MGPGRLFIRILLFSDPHKKDLMELDLEADITAFTQENRVMMMQTVLQLSIMIIYNSTWSILIQ